MSVAAIVLAYGLVLRRYGLDLVDEGTLLAQFADVADGALPYRDFQTGYGPLWFYWNAAVLRLLGGDLVAVRTVLAFVHAISAGLLYAIACRVGGPGVAAVGVALLWGMLRPVAPGAFAVFNIPYPGWMAEAVTHGAVLALLTGDRGRWRLAAIGALWGVAFLTKQNAGVFGLAGTAVYLALSHRDAGGTGPAWPGAALSCAMVLGLVVLGGGTMTGVEWALLGTPVLVLAVAVARARPGTGVVREGAALACGFLAVIVPVTAVLAAAVGPATVLEELFQIGTGATTRFRLAYPEPISTALGVAGDSRGVLVAGRRMVDGLWLLLLPLAAIAGAWSLARRPHRIPAGRAAVAAVGGLSYLQLFPRADLWHALPVAGLLLVLGLVLVRDALPGWRRIGAAMAVCLAAVRSAPTLPAVASALRAAPAEAPSVPHASIRWDLVTPDHLRRAPEVAHELQGVRSLVGFPALAFFNFVTGASWPLRQRYFFPGQPGPEETRDVLRALVASPPDAVLVLDAPIAFFEDSFAAHPAMVAWLRSPVWVPTTVAPYVIGRRAPP